MSESTSAGIPAGDHHDAQQLKQKAARVGQAVADLASEAKHFAAEKVGSGKEMVMDKFEYSKESVREYVVREPYKAIAIAAGVGLLLGMLLKRK